MSIAKVIEISSESTRSYEDAVKNGIKEAAKTVDHIQSAWVKDHEVLVGAGELTAHRVNLNVTFMVDDRAS